MARAFASWITLLVLLESTLCYVVWADTVEDKPSLAQANPLVIVVLALGGLVGVVISVFALRALWRARQYEEDQ